MARRVLVEKHASVTQIERNIVHRLREEQDGLVERVADAHFVKHVRVFPGQVGNDDVGGRHARSNVVHDHVRSEDVIASLAFEVAAFRILDDRLDEVLVDHLQTLVSEMA